MTVQEWLVARLKGSTNITNLISTRIFPDFLPSTASYPGIIYNDIGDRINRKLHQSMISLRSFAASKAEVDRINSVIYNLFDSSTSYISEKSSSLCIDSVHILTNSNSGFDDAPKLYFRALDIQILWHLST